MRFQAILTTPSILSLARRCELLEVSRSGFYAWRRRGLSRRAVRNGLLVGAIAQIHRAVKRRYGSPRMQEELVGQGFPCGRHRVARLMRAHGIRARQARRFLVTTDSAHGLAVAPNLVGRDFTAAGPDQLWMGDITFIPTRQGWAYLAVVVDAWSRRVVGWAVGPELTAALPLAALHRAIRARRPLPGLVHHSDRGSQYASAAYQTVLAQHGMRCSMSRSGDCWDNAVVESFFHTLKVEQVHEQHYGTWDDVEQDVGTYIEEFYNRRRRHSTLGYLSPATFELRKAA